MLNTEDYNIVHYNILNEEISYENFDENNYVKRSRTVRTMGTLENFKLDNNDIIINKVIDNENNEILYSEGYNPNQGNEDITISLLSEDGVYGEDDRSLIDNPNTYPYFPTGRVEMFRKNALGDLILTSVGTGFLEGPNVLVTAAHCVFNDSTDDGVNNSTFIDDIKFYPG